VPVQSHSHLPNVLASSTNAKAQNMRFNHLRRRSRAICRASVLVSDMPFTFLYNIIRRIYGKM